MHTINWRSDKSSVENVVIVKRTAKQIIVRRPGGDTEIVFRQGGYCNLWRKYPGAKSGLASSVTLEIPE